MFKASVVNCVIERLEFKKLTAINQKSNKKFQYLLLLVYTDFMSMEMKICCAAQGSEVKH